MSEIITLKDEYGKAKNDKNFKQEFLSLLKYYEGRETYFTYAKSFSEYLGGAKILLKSKYLNHAGAHKINNVIGQVLLGKIIFFLSSLFL